MRDNPKSPLAALWAAACMLLLLSPTGLAAETEKIVITGASTMAPLVTEIARRYEAENAAVQIDIQSGGSARGISDLRRGLSEIGLVSRELKGEEKDLSVVTLAYDGVAILVHASNPVSSLSNDQIRAIYTGKVTDWKELGQGQGPITVVTKADGRSTLEVFLNTLNLEAKQIKAHVVIGDNEQAVKIVQGNPLAIGYVSVGTIEYHVSAGTPIKAIPIGPVAATSSNVANGSYSVRRPLNIVFRADHSKAADAFIAYAIGKGNHDIVRDYFFIPASNQ